MINSIKTIGIDCRLVDSKKDTGISRYTKFLIDYYVERFGELYVYLITNDPTFYYLDCKIIFCKLKPFNLLHFFYFNKFISSFTFSIYHSPFYSSFFKPVQGVKCIITVHDLMYTFVDGFFGNNLMIAFLKRHYFNFIVSKSLQNSDHIVSVSETTRNDVKRVFARDSIHIPEDSDLDFLPDYSIVQKYKLKHKDFFFYCGNSRPHKNLEFIIKIFNENNNLPTLVLSGDRHKSSYNVIATGIVTNSELVALYKSSLAFIFPSRYEGFGLPIIEALRNETFVIASNIPAFLEFKSRNIFYFQLDNQADFLKVLNEVRLRDFFRDDCVLDYYNKLTIYRLNDILLDRVNAELSFEPQSR